MLRYFDGYFSTFTIHNYSDTDDGARAAVGNAWSTMLNLGKQRQIWLTEFNFSNGTCSDSEQTIVDLTRGLYANLTNERSFYYELADSGGACGSGLLHSRDYSYTEKPILYPGFRSIVSGH